MSLPKTCPECGVDVTKLDRQGHAAYHWPAQISETDPKALGARQRRAALLGQPIPEA